MQYTAQPDIDLDQKSSQIRFLGCLGYKIVIVVWGLGCEGAKLRTTSFASLRYPKPYLKDHGT